MEKKKRLKVDPSCKKQIAEIAGRCYVEAIAAAGVKYYYFGQHADDDMKVLKNLHFEQFAIMCNVCGTPVEDIAEAIDVLMQCTRGRNQQWKPELEHLAHMFAVKQSVGDDVELYKLVRKLPITKLVKLAQNYKITKR